MITSLILCASLLASPFELEKAKGAAWINLTLILNSTPDDKPGPIKPDPQPEPEPEPVIPEPEPGPRCGNPNCRCRHCNCPTMTFTTQPAACRVSTYVAAEKPKTVKTEPVVYVADTSVYPQLVLVNAKWCGPCHTLVNVAKVLKSNGWRVGDTPDNRIWLLDTDTNTDFVAKHNIGPIPTILIMRNGKVIKRYDGEASLAFNDPFKMGALVTGNK